MNPDELSLDTKIAVLNDFKDKIVCIYADRSDLTKDEISSKMLNETWMNANEALSAGIATEII